jgi:hypothetical protein
MLTITDRLTDEDLARCQKVEARYAAVHVNPRAFTSEETERALLDWYEFNQYIFRTYQVDEDEEWKVSPTDGTIYYGTED